jgi:hypothetical protein
MKRRVRDERHSGRRQYSLLARTSASLLAPRGPSAADVGKPRSSLRFVATVQGSVKESHIVESLRESLAS